MAEVSLLLDNNTSDDSDMAPTSMAVGALYSVPIVGANKDEAQAPSPPPPSVPLPAPAPPPRQQIHRRFDTSTSIDSNYQMSLSHIDTFTTPSVTPATTPATGTAQARKIFLPPTTSSTISSAESSLSGQDQALSGVVNVSGAASSAASSTTTTYAPLAQPPTLSRQSSSVNTTTNVKPPLSKPKLKKKQSSTAFTTPVIAAAEPPPEGGGGCGSSGGDASDRLILGICAMDKKARSRPMAEILSRLDSSLFHVVFFGDDVILNKPVQEWPRVQVMIAFYSKGYPLQKAKEYVALYKPFVLNDLEMQEQLKDRRRVYDLLEASGIDVPRHVFLSKDGYVSTGSGDGNRNGDTEVKEFDDHIEINGEAIHKPFVEKPVDADDHNIAIYYPTSAGGGCKKLFRKIGNRSSEFYPDVNEVRRDGSYIYEEFVETQGTDVKMYTVGPEYGHAEARKSPTVDGKVQRNADGKEIRFPVILTLGEKEIARRIVLQFKQFVCGFDLLRVQEGHSVVSYVCDVNGFSFVKNSRYVSKSRAHTRATPTLGGFLLFFILSNRFFSLLQFTENITTIVRKS
jgi:Diphosphoinositol pentakisphosphate kinase 2 N-terminal domain